MPKKVLFIPAEDLKELEITCPKCTHPFVFRLIGKSGTPRRSFFPTQCPHCQAVWGDPTEFGAVLDLYFSFCSGLNKLTPQFRYTVENS